MRRLLVITGVVFGLVGSALVAGAEPDDASLNARFIRWQERDAIVHLFVFVDQGRLDTTAIVPEGKPLMFGFEFGEADLATLETFMATVTIDLSVDGGAWVDVTDAFLENFLSDGTGPPWTWDHDADGRGDGDGDGIGDSWIGFAIAPFRYAHPGMTAGPHTFDFRLDFGFGPVDDHVSFEMIP